MEEPSANDGITIIVVPDRGGGESRQYRIAITTAKRWVVGLSVSIGLLLSLTVYTLVNFGSVGEVERLTAETVELSAELHRVSQSMLEVEQMMDRLRVVDAQLQGLLQTDLLPGRGPLDEEEAELLRLPEDYGRDLMPGEEGEPDYTDPALWLCHPERGDGPCHANLDVTQINADGTLEVIPHQKAEEPAFDCFYVYPTCSLDAAPNSDLDAEEEQAISRNFS